MEPTLKEGEIVWVFNWSYWFSFPKAGDIVVFSVDEKMLIKRVQKVDSEAIILVGDNKNDSFDSRKFGTIRRRSLIGKVLL